MPENILFSFESPVAERQPETDRLILARFLNNAAFFHLFGIDRDDVEYILFTFEGIHEQRTLLPGHVSTGQRIVQKYAEMSFPA